MVSELDIVLRLVLALILGGSLGLERELSKKSFGLRTSAILSISTATFALLMIDFGKEDFARLLPAIITGVGFLGAGVIMKSSDGRHVQGMTTAATLWAIVGIGYAIGSGYIFIPVTATILVFITLMLKRRFWRLE